MTCLGQGSLMACPGQVPVNATLSSLCTSKYSVTKFLYYNQTSIFTNLHISITFKGPSMFDPRINFI